MEQIQKRYLKLFCITALLTTLLVLMALACNGDVRRTFGEISIDNLPMGDLIEKYNSPDNSYTVQTYLCNGGATVDYAVRASVTYNKSWFRRSRNIYWQYHCRDATVTWQDDKTVEINGKLLSVDRDAFDYRLH